MLALFGLSVSMITRVAECNCFRVLSETGWALLKDAPEPPMIIREL